MIKHIDKTDTVVKPQRPKSEVTSVVPPAIVPENTTSSSTQKAETIPVNDPSAITLNLAAKTKLQTTTDLARTFIDKVIMPVSERLDTAIEIKEGVTQEGPCLFLSHQTE